MARPVVKLVRFSRNSVMILALAAGGQLAARTSPAAAKLQRGSLLSACSDRGCCCARRLPLLAWFDRLLWASEDSGGTSATGALLAASALLCLRSWQT